MYLLEVVYIFINRCLLSSEAFFSSISFSSVCKCIKKNFSLTSTTTTKPPTTCIVHQQTFVSPQNFCDNFDQSITTQGDREECGLKKNLLLCFALFNSVPSFIAAKWQLHRNLELPGHFLLLYILFFFSFIQVLYFITAKQKAGRLHTNCIHLFSLFRK